MRLFSSKEIPWHPVTIKVPISSLSDPDPTDSITLTLCPKAPFVFIAELASADLIIYVNK